MTESRELLNDAEVHFLMQEAGEAPTPEAQAYEKSDETVTMSGDLDQISLVDIFQTLAMSKIEGVLRVRNVLEEREVYCADGRVRILVPARMTVRRLGQRLIQAGLLEPEQLRATLVKQHKNRTPLGQLLVQEGLITDADLDHVLGQQVTEDLFALFTWKHGTFELLKGEPGSDSMRRRFDHCPEFEVNSLLLEAARRSDEWERIDAQLNSLDEIPKQIAQPADPSMLGDVHQAVLKSMDGRSSYRQLSDQSIYGLFEFAKAARELAAGGIIRSISDPQLVDAAAELADEGEHKRAVMLLQALRDRPGDRTVGICRRMAEVLEQVGERRLGSTLLLEAAQRSAIPEEAITLAREARILLPYDPETLSFLRTVLIAHAPPDCEELEQVTIDFLDALIEADLNQTALQIIEDARLLGPLQPKVLLREARARQRSKDHPGAIESLLELAAHYVAVEDKPNLIQTYEAVLRLDRTRTDIARLLKSLRRNRLSKVVRLVTGLAASTMLASTGVVWWQHHSTTTAVQSAHRQITKMLDDGDRIAARAVLEDLREDLGDCEHVEDLESRVRFAEAAESKRIAKLRRARMAALLKTASEQLANGELSAALQTYAEAYGEPGNRAEVGGIVTKRVMAAVEELKLSLTTVEGKLPADPAEILDRGRLATNSAQLEVALPEQMRRLYDQLGSEQDRPTLAMFFDPAQVAGLGKVVADFQPIVSRFRALSTAYEEALREDNVQRRLDPLFKAAVRKEAANDFAGALEIYRKLERQPAGDEELRAHFRARVERNETITRRLAQLSAATDAGDFDRALGEFKALQEAFPDVKFAALVRLPFTVKSRPPGAQVTVNGQEVGVTPMVLRRPPSEPTVIELRAPGFAMLQRRLGDDAVASWEPQLTRRATSSHRLKRTIEVAPTALPGGDRILVDRAGDVSRMDGTLSRSVWTYRTGDLSGFLSRALLFGDQLLIASLDGKLRALNTANGEVVWEQDDMPCEVTPALSNGTLWVATTDGRLHAIDLVHGKRVTAELGYLASDELVAYDGDVLVVGSRGEVSRWSPRAKRRWRVDVEGFAGPRAELTAGVLVVTDDQGRLAGIDAASGAERWRTDLGVPPIGTMVAAAGHVLVTTEQRVLRLQASDGAMLKPFRSGSSAWAGAARVVGDRVVVPTRAGPLQVLDRESGRALYSLEGDAKSRLLETAGSLYVLDADRTLRYHRALP